MSIKAYPEFTCLKLSDLQVFTEAFRSNPPVISEFTFANLYAWSSVYKLSVSLLGGLLIVCSESEPRKRFFCPIGSGDAAPAMEKLLKDTNGKFIRLPQEVCALFTDDRRFAIAPDRDNSDYLYNASDLISLAGRKYDGKRNLIRKFKSGHEYEYVRLGADNARLCLDFEAQWCSVKNCDRIEGLANERLAIREMVENFSAFGLAGGAIKINGEISAIALGQELNPQTLVMDVLKADPDIPGLYQVMMQEFLSRQAGGLQYVNLEQDLGIAGLRKAKLSYHPSRMVDKYTLQFSR